jgi:hypothetical protein
VVVLRDRFVVIAALACLTAYVYVYASGRQDTPVRSDAFSYYIYLPSWLLFHDPTLQSVADDCCGGVFPEWTAIHRVDRTGWWVDSHPIGEAVLVAPFFLVAHALTRWSNLSSAGFSLYDIHAAGLAGLCYAVIGLWFLRRLLTRYFTPGVTVATLAAILAGTSLFHYATFDSAWSHAFSFALCAALLERLDAWSPSRVSDTAVIGAFAGLMTLVRHTNVIIPVCLVAATTLQRDDVVVRARARAALVAAAVAFLVVLPQLLLYRAASGSWLINAYGDRGFAFATPHIGEVLFSAQKGLFFYAPVLLAGVAGLVILPPPLRAWRTAAFVILGLDVWLVASWWDWQFGASFGHRAFVDVYPMLALGLAATFSHAASRPPLRIVTVIVVTAFCALSIFQMLQYWHGVLPASDLTWSRYREVFLRAW